MNLAAEEVANTLAGELIVYIVFPLMVLTVVGLTATLFRIFKRLGDQDVALAQLVMQVSPPGSPALRELVHAQAVETASLRALTTAQIAATGAAQPLPAPTGDPQP